MSEDLNTQVTTKTEAQVPHSPEVEEEIVRRLIRDVIVPKRTKLNLPPKDHS